MRKILDGLELSVFRGGGDGEQAEPLAAQEFRREFADKAGNLHPDVGSAIGTLEQGNGVEQGVAGDRLGQVRVGAGLDRVVNVLFAGMRGDGQDGRAGAPVSEFPGAEAAGGTS